MQLFKIHTYVDKAGNCRKIVDRTYGILFVFDTINLWLKKAYLKLENIRNTAHNNSGRYVMRDNKLVKISGNVSATDVWFKHHQIYADQGLRERHNFFVDQDQRGKLKDVNDIEVQNESIRMYGRGKVKVR